MREHGILTAGMAGDGVVELAEVCILSGPVAAGKILACLRMAPKSADFRPGSRRRS
jgi:hypothetical protein